METSLKLSLRISVLPYILVRVVELDEEDNCNYLQALVSLFILRPLGQCRTEFPEELVFDSQDAVVDPIFIHLMWDNAVVTDVSAFFLVLRNFT